MGIVDDGVSAAAWIGAALSSSGYRADFTAGSVWELERFLDEQAPGGQPKRHGLLSQNLGTRLFGTGAYLGEVIRRDRGGEWSGNDSDPQAEINLALDLADGSRIWPVQRVMKRYTNGVEDSLVAYVATLGLDPGPRPDLRPRPRWWRRRAG